MRQIIASADTSTSAMYANISKAVEDMVMQYFPQGFFQDHYTSTEVSYRTMRRYRRYSPKNEIMKKPRPFLSIIPQLPSQDESSFLYGTALTSNWDDMIGVDGGTLSNVISDEKNFYHVAYRINHEKIEYECHVILNTLNQAIDYRQILQNKISWGKVMYYRASLESMIPRSIITQVGRLMHVDLNNPAYVGAFLQRANALSQYPITYKMKNASQRDEFFLYYTHNLLVIFNDLDPVSVIKKNYTDDYAEIRFRVSVQFNMPSVYYVIGSAAHVKDLQISVRDINTCLGDDTIIPIYTLQNVYSMYPPVLDGKKFYANMMFRIENIEEDSILEFSDILREPDEEYDIFYVLKQAHMRNENMNPYISIYMYKDRIQMEEGKDYIFDWANFRIQILTIDIDYTYRALVYLNMGIINDRKNNCYERIRTDKRVH